MDIRSLTGRYRDALENLFGKDFRIVTEDEDYAAVYLDGDREEFMFTLYGENEVRLYRCGMCFIFSTYRSLLTSSDTYGNVVYEEKVCPDTLPDIIIGLVAVLKDCVLTGVQETVTGHTLSGYDRKKDYFIRAASLTGRPVNCKCGNIVIEAT